MRRFSFAPSLTIRGREFHGLRGWAGKPFHPPLTDVPITAYLLAAGFDLSSLAARHEAPTLARELYHAGGWAFIAGAIVSVLAALTGWADWHRSSEPGTQARRTINAHAITMITVTLLALADIGLRYSAGSDLNAAAWWVAVLSTVTALLVTTGATMGGTLVFDYGFNVETATDSPVWHRNEHDVLPGHKDVAAAPVEPTAEDIHPVS